MAKKTGESVLKKEINNIVQGARAPRLTLDDPGPDRDCHAGNITRLALCGHSKLAADHVLFPGMNGLLSETVAGAIRQLGAKFYSAKINSRQSDDARAANVLTRYYAYDCILEMMLSFFGHESMALDSDEIDFATDFILETLCSWESWEIGEYGAALVAAATVDRLLRGMELVQGGASMVAKSACRIRSMLKGRAPVCLEFLRAAQSEIQDNIYFDMVAGGYCKFGNDYALGLRWLRHLGYEQVSTNPVLAALAYKDDPSLGEAFKIAAAAHPMFAEWKQNPVAHGDDITLFATLQALWDNLHVYRPVFYNLADSTGGGVVSFQLNPNIDDKADASIADALKAMEYAQDDLRVYDAYLLAGYEDMPVERARPNMVIKVAASNPAARVIARAINEHGLGSNVTVVYTAGQQVAMILDELAGMAAAVKKGIRPTQLYMTNMGGRFESHLREDALLRLFAKLKRKLGEKPALARINALARANGSLEKVKAAEKYEDKVFAATCYASLKSIDGNVIKALAGVADKKQLEQLEDDLRKSGTLVARRVWHIFFSEKNREKWISYLCGEHLLTEYQARFIMSRLNYLPASKRRPMDTYWTLTAQNMVHTEFGNHQEAVLEMSQSEDFDLLEYVESIRDDFGPDVVKRLTALPDFIVGYELNPQLNRILDRAGIEGNFGARGHTPTKWKEFGSVMKTSTEFRAAYNSFKNNALGLFEKIP